MYLIMILEFNEIYIDERHTDRYIHRQTDNPKYAYILCIRCTYVVSKKLLPNKSLKLWAKHLTQQTKAEILIINS